MDEQEAIQRLKRHDIKGLETLVMQYQVQALRIANMIVHDHSRAEDIVQGVFIRVYRQIATYDASRPYKKYPAYF